MSIEIINTGSELMLGRVLNTHQQWLCSQLDRLGYAVQRQVAINDEGPAIVNAVRESLSRASFVIVTGGLGPTSDDLTRPLIAELLHRKILVDSTTLERIRAIFARRGKEIPFHCEVQAQYPEGALVIPNDYGTAPGLLIELEQNPFQESGQRALLLMLPGPPRELRPLFTEQVIPLLKKKLPLTVPYACLTLKTACTGESIIEKRVAPVLDGLVKKGLEIGYCARIGEVELRLSARGQEAAQVVSQAEAISRQALGEVIYGKEDERLGEVVVNLLRQHHQTLGTAESCTGGFIAHRITNVPGASEVFLGSCVTYSNESKVNLLGVDADCLARYGAVSQEVACQMAAGLRQRLGVDWALSATGIAGPAGGTQEKPVGTVYVGLSSEKGTQAQRLFYPYDRESFKLAVSQFALDWIRKSFKQP